VKPGHGTFPLVIAAPTGAGKTSLARALVDRHSELVFSLSATTRSPRPGENHDVDYHFVDESGFQQLIDGAELLEWAEVHGRRYGTLRRGVEAALTNGRTIVLDIDVQGARMVRAALPAAVLVFVLPPSVAEMRRRLASRGSGEDMSELRRRMRTARRELDEVQAFDYVIVNEDFEEAMSRVEAILLAERCRVHRLAHLAPMLDALRADIDATIERSQ
jgi:guanylate kinase